MDMGLSNSIWDTKLVARIADTEPHAELHSSDVTSVPWLCADIHSIISESFC